MVLKDIRGSRVGRSGGENIIECGAFLCTVGVFAFSVHVSERITAMAWRVVGFFLAIDGRKL